MNNLQLRSCLLSSSGPWEHIACAPPWSFLDWLSHHVKSRSSSCWPGIWRSSWSSALLGWGHFPSVSMTVTSHDHCILPEQLNCQPVRERVSTGNGAVTRAGAKQNLVLPKKIKMTWHQPSSGLTANLPLTSLSLRCCLWVWVCDTVLQKPCNA